MKKYHYIIICGLAFLLLIATLLQTLSQSKIKTQNSTIEMQTLAIPDISQDDQTKYGGTLVWGTINTPTIINPIFTTHSVSASLMDLIYNKLVRLNHLGEIEPDLAESWHISEDHLTYTFNLKKNIKFHDGVECTALDVLFTYQSILNPDIKSSANNYYEIIEKVEMLDRHTVAFILKKPRQDFLYKLTIEIAPKHLLEQDISRTNAYNYKPIGTGPFKFKSWNQKTCHIILDANHDYHEGRPNIDQIEIKSYTNNKQLWAAFMKQEVDLIKFITKEDYLTIKKDPLFKTYQITSSIYYAMVYNLNDPFLSDLIVRKAIAQSINVQEIIDTLFDGKGYISTGHFHPQSFGFNDEIKPLAFNPLKAKIDLMHRGYSDKNDDGIIEKDGHPLVLNILVHKKNIVYKKIVTMIRQQLSAIGIKVSVIFYEDQEELTPEFLKKTNAQAWLRMYKGFHESENNVNYNYATSWHSESDRFGKIWKYKNAAVDQLFESNQKATTLEEKMAAFQKIHQIIYEDQPACFLFFRSEYCAVTSKFKNTENHFSALMPTYTIKDWHFSEPESNPTSFSSVK